MLQLVEKFTQEHERYMMMGGENYEAEIERTLSGLGFTRDDFERPYQGIFRRLANAYRTSQDSVAEA